MQILAQVRVDVEHIPDNKSVSWPVACNL